MDNMEVDSPPEPNPLKPRDRVLRRLFQLGVPEEYLEMQYPGIVSVVTEKQFWIPELVAAILPPDEEVAEVLRESKAAPKKAVAPTMKNRFRECMVWIQWMMFLDDPAAALENLAKMSLGRGVCGAVWGNNDIAYRCRTCEHDPTCAICVPCFQNGNHKDHDYSVIYTGGGCCDCGDVTAWKREGFCSKHKGAEQIQPLPEEYVNSVGPVLDALLVCWKNKLDCAETILRDNSKASDPAALCKKVANELTFVVVEMLLEFCKHSESLLSFVSKRVISLDRLLDILVRAEVFLSEVVVKKLHELLLKLLGEPIFKYEFAKVFLSYYPFVVRESIKEGTDDALKKYPLLSTFSVQIFTVPTLTPRLVKEMNLLSMLLGCLGDIFIHCAGEDGRLQVTKWGYLYNMTIRVVEDIRFVMSHAVVPRYAIHEQREILRTWMKLLSFLQGMSPLKRETGHHIEEENDQINLPFVLSHSIANINSLLVDGAFSVCEEIDDGPVRFRPDMDDRDSIRHSKVGRLSEESSVCDWTGRNTAFISASNIPSFKSNSMASVVWLTFECLRAIENCLEADNTSRATLPSKTSSSSDSNFLVLKHTFSKIRKGKHIFCGLAGSSGFHMSVDLEIAKSTGQDFRASPETDSEGLDKNPVEGDGFMEFEALCSLSLSDWPDIIYDVSSQDVSLHISLHRLLSMLLQKSLKRSYGGPTVPTMTGAVTSLSATYDDFFKGFLGGCHPCGFSAFVMEHPLRTRVFCAEVHAGMWRKNGDAAVLSCEWYRSVRWSEQGLELDLFLLQCCAALAPADLYVDRIVERFGLSDYCSLNLERSSKYEPVLVKEMLTLIIQIVQERRFSGLSPSENLKRELIHKLAIGDATHSQLVKSLPCDLSKFDQLQEILDTVASYSNPSGFNQGMYSLCWMYWKELDLYHPRWNSRDLQVAEERYMRYCSVSALTTQLPRWTKIYPPLRGVARIATCKSVLKIIRAVLYYAVFNDTSESRAPDGVLLTALHLLSLALDICIECRESGDSTTMLTFAVQDIFEGLNYSSGEQSLLSLLVLLMRMHKRENSDNFLDAGNCNLASLIENLLKKFAEMDAGCMTKLQQLAPEVVVHLLQPISSSDTSKTNSASDSEKRKAKARERQAAIMAKMKAEQSKFLSSVDFAADRDPNSGLEERNCDDRQEESIQDICSLCHDPNSKNPVSFLILLQKSRLLSFVDRGPPSWDQVWRPDKEVVFEATGQVTEQSGGNHASSSMRVISSTQIEQGVQSAVDEFADYAHPLEINALVEFLKTQSPSLATQLTCMPGDGDDSRTSRTFEKLEQDMYILIRKEMNESGLTNSSVAESVLLGKYMAALSREMKEHPSASENARRDKAQAESTSEPSMRDGFGPADCDGIYLSSCGHAVHQGCLDRYLSSLKERFVRRIVFEGGHIVDPDQGEFLCPVCRRLANSVLPSLSGFSHKAWKQPLFSIIGSSPDARPLSASIEGSNSLRLQQGLSILQSAANIVGKRDILRTFPLQRNERIGPNLDSISHVLLKLYFPSRQDTFSGSGRINLPMIMWDTLKYSLISTEIAARSGKTSMTPIYGLDNLYKELKSSSGFALSLLLKIVQSLRSKNSLHVLQRFRGIQLFAKSICSGVSLSCASSISESGGCMSCIWKHVEEVSYPETQFWARAADPLLVHDAFSSLMWVIFCLPHPFLSSEDSLLSLIHIFYVVSVSQAIIMYLRKEQDKSSNSDFNDCLITDISKVVGESAWIQQYFVSNYVETSSNIRDVIRRLTSPYLRRCALLWKLLNSSVSAPFGERDQVLGTTLAIEDTIDKMDCDLEELNEAQELEKMFKIAPLGSVLKDQAVRSLVLKWSHHLCKGHEYLSLRCILYAAPSVPFKLMHLPHVYQDLLQRYIKQRCADCKNVVDEPALCLLCGRLCSPNWKPCCRESGCQTHATACGAGTGVFLLIKRTTILLQRCARQAPWPSPYLDAFGEEDIEMNRGKPLYLNEERYAALNYMVASHGLDRSSKVLGQTTIGTFLLV